MQERFTIISRSGTRHYSDIRPGETFVDGQPLRVVGYCGFGVWPDEALAEATRGDCEFCLQELKRRDRLEVVLPADAA
jgi:hypothetical protein